MYRSALRCIMSELIRQERLIALKSFSVDTPKTKALLDQLKPLELTNVLIVTEEVDENLYLSSRNLRNVDVRDVAGIDPVSLISHERVLVTVGALKKLEEVRQEIMAEFGLEQLAISHRIGKVGIGEISLVVAVGSPHRKDAFYACHKTVDRIKEVVPIWKKEVYQDGSRWVACEDHEFLPTDQAPAEAKGTPIRNFR